MITLCFPFSGTINDVMAKLFNVSMCTEFPDLMLGWKSANLAVFASLGCTLGLVEMSLHEVCLATKKRSLCTPLACCLGVREKVRQNPTNHRFRCWHLDSDLWASYWFILAERWIHQCFWNTCNWIVLSEHSSLLSFVRVQIFFAAFNVCMLWQTIS